MGTEDLAALADDLGCWAVDEMDPKRLRDYLWSSVEHNRWLDENAPRLPPQLVQLPDGVYKVTIEGEMMSIEPMKGGDEVPREDTGGEEDRIDA